ncbi:MAG: drug/metabolite exporter YedA [Myxococcaceae bacterium]
MPASRFRVGVALLAVYLIWSSTYLAQHVGLGAFPPMRMAGLRFLLAGSLLFAWLRFRGAKTPSWPQWRGAALLGFLMPALGNGGVAFAQQWISSGFAALAVATVPLWAALFSGLFGRWPSRMEWLGLVLGALGVGLLRGDHSLQGHPLGVLALVIATTGWALGSVLTERVTAPSGLMSSAAQMLWAGVYLSGASVLVGEHFIATPGPKHLLAVTYLIVFGSIVAYSAYTFLLKSVRPTLATSYALVNPALALLLGAVFLEEHVTLDALGAVALILSGVALVLFGPQGPPEKTACRTDTASN